GRNVSRGLIRVSTRKSVEHGQTGNKIWIERACLRQRIRIRSRTTRERVRREEATEAARRPTAECNGKEGSLERKLVYSADIFADVIDAISRTNRSAMMAE